MNLFSLQIKMLASAVSADQRERALLQEQEKSTVRKVREDIAARRAEERTRGRITKILSQLATGAKASNEIARASGCHRTTIFKLLAVLEAEGKVSRSGDRQRTVWHLAKPGRTIPPPKHH